MKSLYTLDNSPIFQWIQLDETSSTNDFLKQYKPLQKKEMTLVTANYQNAGRGQAGNKWESAYCENILFSIKLNPEFIKARDQFIISQAISLTIKEVLEEYTESTDNVKIKWPNDIYWNDFKICGMLIENTLMGSNIDTCIIGVGVNINQQTFISDAPNPISLFNITGKKHETVFVLSDIVKRFKLYYEMLKKGDFNTIKEKYMNSLYRYEKMHMYSDINGVFEGQITGISELGEILIKDKDNNIRKYAFKEVQYL